MVEIRKNIRWIGLNDRTTDLFEGLWPLPQGTSYNSYLIDDKKLAIVDSMKSYFEDKFLEKIEKRTDPADINYLIVNHMEPDHSGALPALRRLAPQAEIICTEKAVEFLESFYRITENIHVVEDGETLDLGDRTLKFFETPFVHWPETMMTYEISDKILFSCDAFGGFGVPEGGIFDDQLDLEDYEDGIVRYFSNIVGTYSAPVQAALQKLADVDVEIIAPSHGIIWRKEPEKIIEIYDKLSSMEGEEGITLIYGSMYGNTEEMMEAVANGIKSAGCDNLRVLDASRVHESFLLSEAWRRKGVIIGTPTYDGQVFPPVDQFIQLAKRKKLKRRIAGVFGSFGWSGGAISRIKSIIDELDRKLIEPLKEFRGRPSKEDLKIGRELGESVANKVIAQG
ncbi:hypothetical protein AKJ57_00795 [candidate division MSBL1 archaeon SCGC-AAA259A05]|uniref:Flavodoxin-like domain-containing protein n=1 Tax=candidate division MSBL1 archaeon SCGC-AAA259A05 TaxID=1698259 RepID=A0A133UBP8_9EURY|nr:hypothetical protein AKJ57_00795 [candidate division MSBL1 archaeon SCGC-AAA259A05]